MRAPRRPAASRTSLADRSWRPSLFTDHARGLARGRGSSRSASFRRPRSSQHVRLHQVIPTAGPTYLHHMYCEFVIAGRQHDQLFCCARRTRHRAKMLTEYPRHQRELLFSADRAHHGTRLAVELRGTQQVGIGITDLRDTGAPRIDLCQQGPPPKRVVHHLSLQSHVDKSTSAPEPGRRDRTSRLNTK